MSEHEHRDPELDPAADTKMFQAFVRRAEQDDRVVVRGKAAGVPFRLLTLGIGLAVFAALVWLLV